MEEDASMKRLLISVAGLSLITGLTFAQMRDVPPGHWAYQSIEQLVQLGIIEGYPDGTFRPNRTMTRAEFAQAIARAYRNIDQRLVALNRRIEELANRPQGGGQQVDTSALERQINELRAQIEELKKLNEAIQTLQRLAQTFQQELAGLGVDVDTLKRDFASLRARVEALEGKEEKFKMSGDLTFGVYGAHSIDARDVYTLNRTTLGPGQFLEAISVPHELGLTFSGQINDEVTGSATFILGNYLPYVGGSGKSALTVVPFPLPYAISNTDIVIWEAFVKAPIDIFGAKVDLTVGRYPAKITPFTLQRIKPDYYLNFPRYGDGAFRVDGGALGFNFDTFRLNLWAAQVNQQSNNGVFNTLNFQNHNSNTVISNSTTSAPMEQFAGARLEFDAIRGEETNLTVGATYYAAGIGPGRDFIFVPSGVVAANIDRVDVFGADIKAKFAGFNIGVEYAQSDFLNNTNRVLNTDNWALDANLGYNFSENLGITAGYREVRPYFAAPGAWGRIGYLYNPSDLRGFYAGVNYAASEDLKINLTGTFLEGTGRVANGYTTGDELIQVLAGVDYRLSDRWNVSLNYEGVYWKLGSLLGSPKPVWNYFTLGVGYNLGENTALNVLYQILDTDGKGVGGVFSGGPAAGKNSGAVAATTLSVKF
ncbi:MAG: S-layer homology domain-containing protein [Armatimonadetes bacterium]|nr:S-layer homology domain-containing protein [Armatimonadota bacterium]